jgi:hypothetical protein
MTAEDTANEIIRKAQIFYQLSTGENLHFDPKIQAIVSAIAEILESQNKIVLNEGEILQENDEWESPITGIWQKIPANWVGQKVIHDQSTTFGRHHIKVRRYLQK